MNHDTYYHIYNAMFSKRFPSMSMAPWAEQRRYEAHELLATMAGMVIVIED